tara:strand:+ start:1215 stop:2912 length:1698 start_codon:yes stop_codon:yes gene_type:complete
MASIIRVRRSTGINPPGSLNFGELGLTVGVGTANNSGGRVFAGDNASNPQVVGGRYYTDLLSLDPGKVASQANPTTAANGFVAILDSDRKVDQWNVDNLTLDTNTLSSTNTDGDIIFNPNGSGDIMIPDDTKLGFGGGANGTAAPDFGIEFDDTNNIVDITGAITKFNNTTQSTTKDNGSVIFEGGVGIEKNLNVGGHLTVGGATTFTGTIEMFDGLVVDSIGISSNVIRSRSGSGNKLYIDPYPDGLSNEGQVIIKGDLQVDGTTTTVNSTSSTLNDGIMKLGDVTSVRTVKTTVGTGVSTIIVDSIVGVNTGDVITGSSSLPGAGTTSIHSFSSQAGISTIFIDGVTTAGIVTTTELTITHAYDTNTDRGISFNYNTSSGTGNNKIGFFGYNDSTGENSQAPVRSFTYIPDATVSNEVVTGTRGNLDIKGIYYQAGDFSTHGVVYFDSSGLQNSTAAPAAFTAADTSTHILTAITEVTLALPSGQNITIGDQITQVGNASAYGVTKTTITGGTTLTLVGVNGTFNNSGDLLVNGTSISISPNSVSTVYTDKPVWSNCVDGGTF